MFFFAGTDTTSSVITSTLHMLKKYPHIKDKLMGELNQNGNFCNTSTIKKMKYMDAVFNETLRLYGPLNAIGKR